MAPSPDGDRWRPLHRAVRSTRSLGMLFLLLGGCASIPLFIGLAGAAAAPPARSNFGRIILLLLFYLAPGVIYLLCASSLTRRRFWAVVTTMTVAGTQLIVMAIGLGSVLYAVIPQQPPAMLFLWIPIVITIVLILALVRLEYQLVQALAAIRKQQVEDQRGFEPLAVPAVVLEPTMIAAPPSSPTPPRGPDVPAPER